MRSPNPDKPVEIFITYSHKDERMRQNLETHLTLLKRQGIIDTWHDRRIGAGTEWAKQIDEHLNTAEIILLLVSSDFLASDYCYDIELRRAMDRHAADDACVIPIILRPCDWSHAPFGKLQALPKDGKPINTWQRPDEAFLNVAQGILIAVKNEIEKAIAQRQAKDRISDTDKVQKPPSALLCEDEGLHVMAARKALSRAGYFVVGEAREGREAITLAKELQPDLVLMDINMPGPVDGIDATREILKTHPMPIIMLTAYSDNESVNASLDAGACAYLVKPITSEQLLPAIRAALTNFQALQAALHETSELKDALENRKLVAKAKGIYMEKHQVPEGQAFLAIQKISRDKCQTMKETALQIIKESESKSSKTKRPKSNRKNKQ